MSDECTHPTSRVVDSRPFSSAAGWAAIRRRRACTDCGARWSSVEIPDIEYADLLHRSQIADAERASLREQFALIANEIADELLHRVAATLETPE